MSISKYFVPISEGVALVKHLLIKEFAIDENFAEDLSITSKVHFDNLNDNCYLLAETAYIDKVYRNSYYNYYSSKLVQYKRECVRISLFEGEIKEEDFANPINLEYILERYRGFIILRPTEPKIIGRSLISPIILKNKGFLSCTVNLSTTVNSIKVSVSGFPYSSQDGETITCAETTLWAIMEYFGNKYPEYKPILPSIITETLNKVSFERQIPSMGLNIQQMSFALKEFGFGTRIYSEDYYGKDFARLLSTYTESGIPVILGVDNCHIKDGDIGHAILCVGREKINNAQIDNIEENLVEDMRLLNQINSKNISFYDWDDIVKQYVFIDDNHPVYQRGYFDKPVEYYNNLEWSTCSIKHFIVPLYPKIYLEAYEAKNYIYRFLVSEFSPLEINTEVLIRFYLVSSRSFKQHITLHSGLQEDIRELILESPMPKFVWITELGTKTSFKNKKAEGLLILDATEANLSYNYPLLFAYYRNKVITPNFEKNNLEQKIVPLSTFSIYEENLKPV